jgi:hypothetical protein
MKGLGTNSVTLSPADAGLLLCSHIFNRDHVKMVYNDPFLYALKMGLLNSDSFKILKTEFNIRFLEKEIDGVESDMPRI